MSGARRFAMRLVPPIELTDPAGRLSGTLVRAIVHLLLVATVGFSLVAIFGLAPAPRAYALTLPAGLALLGGLRWMVHKGHARAAAVVLCLGAWLIICSDLPLHGADTVSVGGFILLIVIGGLTLGPAAALAIAAGTVALLASVLLRPQIPGAATMPSNPARWVHYTTQLILTAVVVAWWALRSRRLLRDLRVSEERYARLVEASPDAIASFDPDGTLTFCNSATERLFGYERSLLVGRHWDEAAAVPKADLAALRANFAAAIESGVAPEHEIQLSHRDGHVVPVEVKSVALREDGKVVGLLSMLRDISMRKQAEAERASLERQLVGSQRM